MRKKCIAVVLAAGSGRRMNAEMAKQYMLLDKKPIIWYSLHAFETSVWIDDIIVVVGKGEVSYCKKTYIDPYGFTKVVDVIEGGSERFLSVWQAILAVDNMVCLRNTEYTQDQYIFLHDAARPFINDDIIRRVYEGVQEYQACSAGMPVKDTIKITDSSGMALETPNRSNVWMVQTPQVFDFLLLKTAYQKLMDEMSHLRERDVQITDDTMVVEMMLDKKVKMIEASYMNIKITTPEDIFIAESFLKQ